MSRSRHDGLPPQGPEFGEFLRRELHAAADQLEPRPDGLERIRARVGSGPAYASKHSAARRGFLAGYLAGMVRRWKAARGGQDAEGAGERQQPDWRYGWLRPALAAACAVFAIGVALSVPPLRQAFVQLGSAVGLSSSSSQETPSLNGSATQNAPAGAASAGGTSAVQSSVPVTACASGSPSSAAAKSANSVAPSASPVSSPPSGGTSSSPSASATATVTETVTETVTGTPSATSAATGGASTPASAKANASATGGKQTANATRAPCPTDTVKPSKTAKPAAPVSAKTPGLRV